MKIYIKYMVSVRCKMFVENELSKLGLHCSSLELGEVDVMGNITPDQFQQLNSAFAEVGLELLVNRNDILVEKIKGVIVEMFHHIQEASHFNFSDSLEEKLHYDYNYMSSIFSESVGVSIEHYIIAHKIENIKTMLSHHDLNLSEISYKLNYKNLPHLCNQFKQITGQTPSFYKAVNSKRHP